MFDPVAEQPRPDAEEEAKPITVMHVLDVSDVLKLDDISDNVDGSHGTTNGKDEILHESSTNRVETGESSKNVREVVEEELVELEFEKVKPKLATHSMHCPNCKSKITKVILRRKVPEQRELVGCFSCSSLFTWPDNRCFNPFDMFRKKPKTRIYYAFPPDGEQKMKVVVCENGSFQLLTSDLPKSSNATGDVDTTIMIETEPGVVAQSRTRSWLGYEGILAEILKSIVYGGLMEVIASLSVVASAAASDATTLCIVSLALGSLIGGVFIIGHNLWDLRNDCYKYNSSQETKYKELLGQVNYFPLHAFFAILSFLVFGMVPPVTYKYSYHETKDRDFTLVMVAAASILCVLLLATLKVYINKYTVLEYFKTVIYYIIIAVSVSGVSYVVGNLVSRLLKEFGWFDTRTGAGMPCLPHTTNPYLETF